MVWSNPRFRPVGLAWREQETGLLLPHCLGMRDFMAESEWEKDSRRHSQKFLIKNDL
jgi:hypothetical protein